MEIFGVKMPSQKELEQRTREVMAGCERHQRGECDCTASRALTECEVDALLVGCGTECLGPKEKSRHQPECDALFDGACGGSEKKEKVVSSR